MRPRRAANEAGGRPGDVNRRDEAESGTSGGQRRAGRWGRRPSLAPGPLRGCRRPGDARPAPHGRPGRDRPQKLPRGGGEPERGPRAAAAAAGTRGTIVAEGAPPSPFPPSPR